MENEYPKRKNLRIPQYNYSSAGGYFITVYVKGRKPILSNIIKPVGVGALDDPQLRLTRLGRIVEKYLLSTENISGVKIDRYVIMPDHIHAIIFLNPDKYNKCSDGSSRAPTPTELCEVDENIPVTESSQYPIQGKRVSTSANEMLPHIISTFKRFCSKEIGENLFQRGYMEHIIRDREDYETRVKYICENPLRRYYSNVEKGAAKIKSAVTV